MQQSYEVSSSAPNYGYRVVKKDGTVVNDYGGLQSALNDAVACAKAGSACDVVLVEQSVLGDDGYSFMTVAYVCRVLYTVVPK